MSVQPENLPTESGGPKPRVIAALLCIFIVLGIAAWLGVDAWLATQERNARRSVEVSGASGSGLDPAKRSGNDYLKNEAAPDVKSPAGEKPSTRLPVLWAVAPPNFPERGIAATLHGSRDEAVSPLLTCSFHEKFVEIEGQLADGAYFWNSDSNLYFPAMNQPSVVVCNGVVTLHPANPDMPKAFMVYFLIPVRLIANTSGEAEVPVFVRCRPTSSPREIVGFQLDVVLRHGVELNANLPPNTLSFSRKSQSNPLPADAEIGVRCSIGERAPQPNELIELTIVSDVEWRVNLVSRNTGGVMKTLREAAGITVDDAGTRWLDQMAFRLKVYNWSSKKVVLTLAAAWLISPNEGTITPSLRIKAPPLDQSSAIQIEVLASPSPDSWREQPIALAEVELDPAQSSYDIDANVLEYDWRVKVTVQDAKGIARPDFAVSVQAMSRVTGGTRWIGPRRERRTSATGNVLFEGLPAATGVGVRVTPEVPLPRKLNPDFKRDYWFDGANLETTLTLIVPEDFAQPVVFVVNPVPPVETRSGLRVSTPVPYLVLPQPQNAKLVTDVEAGHITDNAGRLVTAIRDPGNYDALLMTQGGEVFVSFRHDGIATTEVPVRVEPAREVKVKCVRDGGDALDGAVIFTSALDPALAWALAMGEQKNFLRYFQAQTTGKDGVCKFSCQPGNADPRSWRIYHKALGLFKAKSIGGSPESGYELTGANTLPNGSLTVRMEEAARTTSAHYTVCLTPVFCDAGGELSGLFVYLGQTIEIEGESVQFPGLPAGRYAVAIVQVGENTPQAKGPKWSKVVQIGGGENLNIILPVP